MHNYDFKLANSEAIEDALSRRLDAIRLSRNITQSALAKNAGVSRSTVTRLAQDGKGLSLDSFIRILKALDLETQLEFLLPNPENSPLERLLSPQKKRQRARPKPPEGSSIDEQAPDANDKQWTWSDESTE